MGRGKPRVTWRVRLRAHLEANQATEVLFAGRHHLNLDPFGERGLEVVPGHPQVVVRVAHVRTLTSSLGPCYPRRPLSRHGGSRTPRPVGNDDRVQDDVEHAPRICRSDDEKTPAPFGVVVPPRSHYQHVCLAHLVRLNAVLLSGLRRHGCRDVHLSDVDGAPRHFGQLYESGAAHPGDARCQRCSCTIRPDRAPSLAAVRGTVASTTRPT